MPDWIPPLIPQFGALIIFIWYLRYENERRDKVTRDNHAEWRVFLGEQQGQNNAAIARIAEEVKRNTEAITAMSATLITHDIRSATAIEDVRRIRERLTQARVGDVEQSPIPPGRS